MDRVLSGMTWSRCLVYLDDVISFGTVAPEAMLRLTEMLERLSSFSLTCDPDKLRQFVLGIRQTRLDKCASLWVSLDTIAGSLETLPTMALTHKGTVFAWTTERQAAFDALKSCLLRAPILGFPTKSDRFVLDTEIVSSRLAAVTMCTHFRSYLRGVQFTLRTDHCSLRWLQKFCNSDGMLARCSLL